MNIGSNPLYPNNSPCRQQLRGTDSGKAFNFDDPINDLKLFELCVELPYSAISGLGGSTGNDLKMSAKVVFRNGRSVMHR